MIRRHIIATSLLAGAVSGCAEVRMPQGPSLTPTAPAARQAPGRSVTGSALVERRQYYDQRRQRYYFYDRERQAYFWEDGSPKT